MAREAKGYCKVNLRAIADDLMSRFAILEAEQKTEGACRHEADGIAATEKGRVTPTMAASGSAAVAVDPQEVVEEASPEYLYRGEEQSVVLPLSGESAIVPGTPSLISAWPCLGSRQFNSHF